ncbi:TetR/AcrR family transcriptional regulator [Paractinoplanes globisporus]|uniref:TetR/AcrR family transcriptional regulator n=1 Tax=Paractinoplanes globisporus TaxID=113565 RepID=A0ABW6WDV3_9ACTN|nr:TetR/AcrR family transcriptional regulator [Actinoplanes globisporus]
MPERTKGKRTEEELKNAARRLLVSKNYAEIKVTDITAEAGKAAGVFYRYFTDKDALLRALAADFEEALHAVVLEQVGDDHGLRTVDDVRRHVEAFWTTYEQYLPERRGILQASMLNAEFQGFNDDLRDRQIDIWANHILDAKAGISAPQARMSALAVVCLLEYFCYSQFAGGSVAVDREMTIETAASLIATGLLGTIAG